MRSFSPLNGILSFNQSPDSIGSFLSCQFCDGEAIREERRARSGHPISIEETSTSSIEGWNYSRVVGHKRKKAQLVFLSLKGFDSFTRIDLLKVLPCSTFSFPLSLLISSKEHLESTKDWLYASTSAKILWKTTWMVSSFRQPSFERGQMFKLEFIKM